MKTKVREKIHAVRARVGSLWWYSSLMFVSNRVADLLNLYIGLFLLPQLLTMDELGSVEPILRLAGFIGVPMGVVSVVGAKYVSKYRAAGQIDKVRRLARDMVLFALLSGAAFFLVMALTYPALDLRLRVGSPHLFVGLVLFAFINAGVPVVGVLLQGMQRFSVSAWVAVIDPLSRLVAAYLLIPFLRVTGYLTAFVASGVAAIAVSTVGMRDLLTRRDPTESYYSDLRGMGVYAGVVGVASAAFTWISFLEPFVVRHFLDSMDSAGYFIVVRLGSIPMFLVGAVCFVVFPMLSHRHEQGHETESMFKQAMWVTGLTSLAGAVIIGLTARWILGLRGDWAPYQVYSTQVGGYGLVVVLQSVIALYWNHELACRRFSSVGIMVGPILLETVVLYGGLGWGALQPHIDADLWGFVAQKIPRNLTFVIAVMFFSRALTLLGLALHWRRLQQRPELATSRTTGESSTP